MAAEETISDLNKKIEKDLPLIEACFDQFSRRIVGQKAMAERLLIALMSDGHVLLEGVPGLAKTLAMRTLAEITDIGFRRIQFTPDLLPSDLLGTLVFNQKSGSFDTKKGPIFTNLVLADEINRAPAKVQSALLEAMQEHQVTIGDTTYQLDEPFMVVATQNPIEHEGTYPLPEAQIDRFMLKVFVDYPEIDEEKKIIRLYEGGTLEGVKPVLTQANIKRLRALVRKIYLDEKVLDYIVEMVFATRRPAQFGLDQNLFAFGASPRATLALAIAARALALINGRAFVMPDDVREIALEVLGHRIIPSYEAEAEGLTSYDLVKKVLEHVPVP